MFLENWFPFPGFVRFGHVMFGNGNMFLGNWFLFPGFVRFGNENMFPGNWFLIPGPWEAFL